jgi:hypothetical protein
VDNFALKNGQFEHLKNAVLVGFFILELPGVGGLFSEGSFIFLNPSATPLKKHGVRGDQPPQAWGQRSLDLIDLRRPMTLGKPFWVVLSTDQ